jgi:hypothetical protein
MIYKFFYRLIVSPLVGAMVRKSWSCPPYFASHVRAAWRENMGAMKEGGLIS